MSRGLPKAYNCTLTIQEDPKLGRDLSAKLLFNTPLVKSFIENRDHEKIIILMDKINNNNNNSNTFFLVDRIFLNLLSLCKKTALWKGMGEWKHKQEHMFWIYS